ncbi:hypothetical protein P3S67_022760 [Capsicum chacoense]
MNIQLIEFLALLVFFYTLCLAKHTNFSDYAALLAFKSSLRMEPHNILSTNWSSDTHFCSWYGVSCLHQRVVALQLPNLSIQGRIASDIANLTKLAVLDLSSNDLNGNLPSELGFLQLLRLLNVTRNSLDGTIPPNISRCRLLQEFHLSDNMNKGSIPQELGLLSQLRLLRLNDNNLTGKIPSLLGNLPKMEYFYLHENDLEGEIPDEIGDLSKLRLLSFRGNNFTGSIPASIFNISRLQIVNLSINAFLGELPSYLGNYLPILEHLFLKSNRITGKIRFLYLMHRRLLIFSSLKMICKKIFQVSLVRFTGPLPMMLGNLQNNLLENKPGATKLDFLNSLVTSRHLVYLILQSNPLNRIFPESIGNLSSNIRVLAAGEFSIRGSMTKNLGNLSSLIYLGLESNNLVGNVAPSFVGLQNLERLYLTGNKLEGPFPAELCSIGRLGQLLVGENRLSGTVPSCIGNLTELREISIAANSFSSKLPSSFWRLVKLDGLNLSRNLLHGFFPSDVGTLKAMRIMDLSFSKFFGKLSNSIGSLQNLVLLDMSSNAFQGPTPDVFSNLKVLEHLDLSSNALSGVIPNSLELLRDLKYINVSFNNLQGEVPKKGVFANLNYRSRRKHVVGNNESDSPPRMGYQKITYYELLQATENFSQSNLVGSGSSGTVYRAMVLEYMPNGSLNKKLYSEKNCLHLVERLNIMIDIPLAMEYLHHDYTVPVMHCDLKPANVLLDQDLTAHVADVGIAKMLAQEGNIAQTKTLGTIGYIAPEYGLDGQVSTSSDVYSFGILLLETFTRKKTTNDKFRGNLSLHKWVCLSFPDAVLDILDADLVSDIGFRRVTVDENQSQIKQLLVLIINVAFLCLKELPEERINMREVVVQLKKIRAELTNLDSYRI